MGTPGSFWWGVPPGSPNPDSISDSAPKIHTHPQTWPLRNYVIISLPSPWASLLCAADPFRVTWSEKVFEASPGRSSRIRHRNALTERAWKDAVKGLGKSFLTLEQ